MNTRIPSPPLVDGRGIALSGATPAALPLHEGAAAAFLHWREGAEAKALAALALAPGFTMAHVLLAWLRVNGRDPARVRSARPHVAFAAALPAHERERLHVAALQAALADDFVRMHARLDELLRIAPCDALALQVAHAFDHLAGDEAALLARVEAVLPAWSRELPGYSAVLSMHAFALGENGRHERAEHVARAALAIDPLEACAHHAMAHVFEMTHRPEAGLRWMHEHAAAWASGSAVSRHAWWHVALYELARDNAERQGVIARGLLQRASRWLDGQTDSVERGHCAWMSARMALGGGDAKAALAHADEACRIGRAQHDADLECLGRVYRGHGLMSRGDVAEGLAQHDEAAAMIRLGGVCPWAAGWALCSILYAARYRNDWLRAAQFAQAYEEWSRASRMPAFPGTCQLHRAAVLNVQGELEQATAEVRSAAALLAQAAPWAEGDAYCVLGDIQLSVGDLEDAEASYRQAHALGWNPQPGLARLQLLSGRAAEAQRGLEQALDTPDFTLRERRTQLLCLMVHAAVAAGDIVRAREAMDRLGDEASPLDNESLTAMHSAAEAELALADGNARLAALKLRRAVREWRKVGSPVGEVEARLRLAECLLDDGDPSGAELELHAVQTALESAAGPHRGRLAALRARLSPG